MPFTPFEILTADELTADIQAEVAAKVAAELALLMPAGSLILTARSTAPTGWLICDGTAVSRTTFAALFAAIGTAYGAGDGSTTFNLPDLRQRFPLGKAASGTGSTLGANGGAIDHTHGLTINHLHGLGAHVHALDTATAIAQITMGAGTANWPRMRRLTGLASWTDNLQVSPTGAASAGGAQSSGAGLQGDTAAASGTTDATNPATSTGAQNPPFVTVNFIVKT